MNMNKYSITYYDFANLISIKHSNYIVRYSNGNCFNINDISKQLLILFRQHNQYIYNILLYYIIDEYDINVIVNIINQNKNITTLKIVNNRLNINLYKLFDKDSSIKKLDIHLYNDDNNYIEIEIEIENFFKTLSLLNNIELEELNIIINNIKINESKYKELLKNTNIITLNIYIYENNIFKEKVCIYNQNISELLIKNKIDYLSNL